MAPLSAGERYGPKDAGGASFWPTVEPSFTAAVESGRLLPSDMQRRTQYAAAPRTSASRSINPACNPGGTAVHTWCSSTRCVDGSGLDRRKHTLLGPDVQHNVSPRPPVPTATSAAAWRRQQLRLANREQKTACKAPVDPPDTDLALTETQNSVACAADANAVEQMLAEQTRLEEETLLQAETDAVIRRCSWPRYYCVHLVVLHSGFAHLSPRPCRLRRLEADWCPLAAEALYRPVEADFVEVDGDVATAKDSIHPLPCFVPLVDELAEEGQLLEAPDRARPSQGASPTVRLESRQKSEIGARSTPRRMIAGNFFPTVRLEPRQGEQTTGVCQIDPSSASAKINSSPPSTPPSAPLNRVINDVSTRACKFAKTFARCA
eukprot:SAG31_NODE_27_length_32731_cov_1443.130393_22_plen_378_part_00